MAAPNAANATNAQFAAVADAVEADLADGQRKIDELNKVAQQLSNSYAVLGQMANGVNGDASAREPNDNGYMSLVAEANAEPAKYGNAMRSNDSPVQYRSTVTRTSDNGPADSALDSVERSLQTLDGYLETLKQHLPPHAQCFHELGLEAYKEFKKMLHRGEDALVRAYAPPEAAAEPSPVSDLVRAAVEEVMAES